MIARRTRLLARTFFGRLFENDLFSSSVSASNGLIWLLAAVATPGVMATGNQLFFYAHARSFAPERLDRILLVSQAFHVDFAMAIAAVVTMLIWTSLTPDRRDALVLGPLPVRPAEQARARLLALACFVSLFGLAVSIPTGVVFTFVTLGVSSVATVLAHLVAHVVAALTGCVFVFFALVDLQLVVAAALGPRAVRTLTWPLQAAALLAMVAAISATDRMTGTILADDTAGALVVAWNPAAWFVGLYRWMAGDARPIFGLLAGRAAGAFVIVIGGALSAYPLAFQRCLRNAIAFEGRAEGGWSGAGLRWWLGGLGMALGSPLERGLARFIVVSIARSHAHRFLIGSYLGVALLCALPLAGPLVTAPGSPDARYAWLAVPLGLLCWSSAALRVAMMLPVEPAANWVFKLTEPADKRRLLSTAAAVIQAATAVPLAIASGAFAGVAGGWRLGVMVSIVVLAVGLGLAELLTLTLRTVPCACTYRPGQLRLRVLWPLYLITWLTMAFQVPTLALRRLDDPVRFAWLVVTLIAIWLALRTWRLARVRAIRGFVYEELEEPATTTINLNAAGT